MLPAVTKLAFLATLAAFPLAVGAQAQEVSFRLGKSGKHGPFSLEIGSLEIGRGGRARCEPVYERCEPARLWVPGRHETRCERVWVPGCERKEWVPPCFEWRIGSCGERFRVMVREGYWRVVREPGRYETREVSVWVPGHWEISARRY